MSRPAEEAPGSRYDYATVGHVTVDVLPDGVRRPGGTAFYSALQAARLGRRALIVTAGDPDEIEELLAPYRSEVDLLVAPAARTTTLATAGLGADRRQRLLAWAGPIPGELAFETALLHLAPVARELPGRWKREAGFVGLTPQGLLREWAHPGAELELPTRHGDRARAAQPGAPEPTCSWPRSGAAPLPGPCGALVLSELELASCPGLAPAAIAQGAVVAVTAGPAPTRILLPDGAALELAVPEVGEAVDDLGAGDVFAAAFFLALADGREPATAAAFANAAAAVRMRARGPGAIGGREAIDARMRAAQPPAG
jgi:sugar/nucleoside kinase (ribokinase family)